MRRKIASCLQKQNKTTTKQWHLVPLLDIRVVYKLAALCLRLLEQR